MNAYVTLTDASAERTVLRSVFRAFVFHIESEEEAAEKLAALRKEYHDATHVCYAYVADTAGNVTKSSDDGEPSGSAGAPILAVLAGGGYRQVLLAVVRYFGGTKLGVGGLVKAYTDVAVAATERAGKRRMIESECYEGNTDYNTFGKIERAAKKGGGKITVLAYADSVRFELAFPEGTGLYEELRDVTAGKTEFIRRGQKYEIY